MKQGLQKSKEAVETTKLQNILITRRNIIIRTANSELVNLFWQIGTQIKQTKAKFSEKKEKLDILALSSILKKQYGNFFSAANLHKMELFSDLFPNIEEVHALSYFFSWKHFLLFLRIKHSEIRNYYIKLAIQNDFSPKELESKINESIAEDSSSSSINSLYLTDKKLKDSKKILNYLVQTAKTKPPNCRNIESIFKKPIFSAYRSLTAPKSNSLRNFQNKSAKNLKKSTDIFIEEIFKQINNFSQQQNFLINAHLNLLLWEISKYVNEEPLSETNGRKKELKNYDLIISNKNFDDLFTRKELYEIAKFAKEIPDLAIATWMAHVLGWKHIRILLSLENLEAIIYYSVVVARNNMNVQTLKRIIQTDKFDARSYKNAVDRELVSAFQNPLKRKTTNKINNAIETITSIHYEFKDICSISLTVDIFKNQWFIKLAKFNPEELL